MKRRPSNVGKPAYKAAPHVAWRRVEEESVLLNVDTSEYYSLDPIATEIWERIGKGNSLDQISRTLAREYHTPMARVQKDAIEFIDTLLGKRLLLKVDPSVPAPN